MLRRVQELAKGRSLAQLVRDGWRGSEDEIKQLAAQLLDILQYLAGRRPPVTHRWDFSRQTVVGDALLRPCRVQHMWTRCQCFLNGSAWAAIRDESGRSVATHLVASCRDVKPENIILEGDRPGGRVFLVDFGGVQV